MTYKTLNTSYFVSVATVEAAVGRVRCEVGKDEWAIIDRSGAYASTILMDDDAFRNREGANGAV